MKFDVITIFPGFFASVLEHGVFKRALAGGQLDVRIHDLRDYTDDRHRTVDDRPFGGGPGMVLKPEPLFRAVEALRADGGEARFPVILLSPQGRLFSQAAAAELARQQRAALICGRYEGVDERVATRLATDEISIGDYVLAGGELAAAVVMETVTRLVPGVLGNEESPWQESFSACPEAGSRPGQPLEALGAGQGSGPGASAGGVLDFPQYTRPPEFRGLKVPEILLSGDHAEIRRWRRRQALAKTWRRRPDLLPQAALSEDDLELLGEVKREAAAAVGRG
ncbi:MAG TPA: tRNA (guanosine(37)-N1)-methyltransferase TrmD [Terriglobia bacterium]|nr:tRNA (guanosine(37)-N1)-methyltransferase TrmD [Terriglobia bacterium]